jgi:cytochrome P450
MERAPDAPAVIELMTRLASPAAQADPYPTYDLLRGLGESVIGPDDALIVTGYRPCSALLRDGRLRKNPDRLLTLSGFPDWKQRPALRTMFTSMLMINPPDHTRIRGSVARVFTARRVAALRPAVQHIAHALLDKLPSRCDFIDAIGFPFPVAVVGELLGVPSADRSQFRELVANWSAVLEILNPPAVDRADAAAEAIIDYFTELARTRRRAPQDDLLSALVSDGAGLSEEEVVTTAALILAAGFETTTGLLANGLLALLEHPEQAQRLRDEPDLARAAVGELLRYDSPVQMIYGRTAVQAIEVGGVSLTPGQRVITVLGAANRDPAVFSAPNELRLDRDEGQPLSFGAGIHHCLGAALARLEAEVMLPTVVRRFPAVVLDGRPEPRPGLAIHSYRTLPLSVN